jgi:hypothetical protein
MGKGEAFLNPELVPYVTAQVNCRYPDQEIRQSISTIFPDMPASEALYMLRGGGRQSTPQGEMLSGNIGAQIPLGNDTSAMLMLAGSRPEREQASSKAMMAMLNQRMGEGNVGATLVRPLDAPGGLYAGGGSEWIPGGANCSDGDSG